METLYTQLEQLMSAFLSDFLEKLLFSNECRERTEIEGSLHNDYLDYLKRFSNLQKLIENSPVTSKEDTLQRSYALSIIKSTSKDLLASFLLGDQ